MNRQPHEQRLNISYNVRLSEAPGYGQTIFEYAPRSVGVEDYKSLTERILRHG